jgi:hypothetical protein
MQIAQRRHRDDAIFEDYSMKYKQTLLTLAILGPMAVALSSCGTDSTYAYNGAYLYDYPYPDGGFFFGDDRRFHHRFDHHDHDARHDGPRHDPGSINHGGSGGVRSGSPGMFIPGGEGHRR